MPSRKCISAELEALAPLEADGLLHIGEHDIVIHERGRPFLRNICMPFDAYLDNHKGDTPQPQFSATV